MYIIYIYIYIYRYIPPILCFYGRAKAQYFQYAAHSVGFQRLPESVREKDGVALVLI